MIKWTIQYVIAKCIIQFVTKFKFPSSNGIGARARTLKLENFNFNITDYGRMFYNVYWMIKEKFPLC